MAPPEDEMTRLSRQAAVLVERERHAEALACLDVVLAGWDGDMEVHNTRGRALLGLGHIEAARASFALARDRDPGADAPVVNFCLVLEMLGRREAALAEFDAALARWPAHREIARRRALLLGRMGRRVEALAALQRLLAAWPDDLGILIDRGNAQLAVEHFAGALSSYDQALAMAPRNADAHYNRGIVLQALERHAEAVAAYDRALAITPDMTAALINRANSLRRLIRHAEAMADYRRVLELRPGNAMALGNLGKTLGEIGRRAEALDYLDQAIAADPAIPETRWMRVTTTIPAIRHADEDISASRTEFGAALAAYDRWAASVGDLPAVVNIGRPHPFFLPYQEANNRDLMARYGAHCARVMGRWMTEAGVVPARPRPVPEGALRVGIVSAHILTQSVWLAIVRGWLQYADPARVAYHVFYLGAARDPQTDLAERLSAGFAFGVRGLRDWVAAIQEADPDVLVYPEIGMDEMTVKLASMRLAPVQVAAWGHPETTGIPTVDAFVSADALEPPDAQAHYTEKLVRLPGLGCCYTPLPVPVEEPDLAALGLRADSPILLCPGVPFKYAPEYDHVYVDIARRVENCQLVFFRQDTNPLLSDAVFARLRAAFVAAGLEFDRHVRPIPWQTHARFYGLMRRADLFLDTIGFSGFNTAIQAMECGLPVVTVEGKFMRGRLASGILREMEMPELVAADPAEYVDIVETLMRDAGALQDARAKILRNREKLFGDVGAVRAFEAFLHDVVRRAAAR